MTCHKKPLQSRPTYLSLHLFLLSTFSFLFAVKANWRYEEVSDESIVYLSFDRP